MPLNKETKPKFNLYIDIVLILYIFCANILFFTGSDEEIVKRKDIQRGITNKQCHNNNNNDDDDNKKKTKTKKKKHS